MDIAEIDLECQKADCFELLVMSEAGKPIYSYSKRDDAVTLMPLCSTLISYASKAQKESLTSMQTSDNLIINFNTRPPLIIIVIHEAISNIDSIILVEQVEAQIISILTAESLRSLFETRPTFDLKRLLYGSEKLIDSIVNTSLYTTKSYEWPWVQAFLAVSSSQPQQPGLNVVRPHRMLVPVAAMPSNTRDSLHNTLQGVINAKSKNIVFSLLLEVTQEHPDEADSSLMDSVDEGDMSRVSFQLVTICNHHNKHKLKIADIHIILALLMGSRTQLASVESLWIPVCLPRFNPDAFLHSYIAYLNEMEYCLVMFSVDRDEFSNCQLSRDGIETKLKSLNEDASQRSKLNYRMSPLVHPILLDPSKQQTQIYNSKLELYHARQLQFLWYQTSRQVLWWQRSPDWPISQALYYVTKKMLQSSLKTVWLKLSDKSTFLGWHVPTFQLYAQFDETVSSSEATMIVQRITNWIKKEEENFAIRDYK